ncbi:DUF58 domain-containing protein [Agromyces seonyuensis]|uniref:DUF58 domain-containing protein n=1 Tax=Agromyces seonyuensis TaxID=2662446 RepID=A0A6I4P284_9MICO|nr:DUF58 domain-containing protein [Agromyces seonyuensis]MWB98865.1 DUF58 domain-containing protein [Agromyces seonyuensis]
MALTVRFVVLLALGIVPVVLAGDAAWWMLLGWVALVAALAGLDAALAGSPRALALERRLPDRVRLGEPVVSTLVLSNIGSRRVRATVRDGWPPSAGLVGDNRARVMVPPGEGRRIETTLVPWRRGDRTSEAVTVRSTGLLGLAARQATLAAPGRLRVLPPFRSRKHLPSRLARLRELDGATPVAIRGRGTEFDSLREYVDGDDVRSIDWRATARRNDPAVPGAQRLMVRTWRPERDRRIVIVADASRTAAARIADEPRLDTAFEASLLLAALAGHAGDRVDFLAWDRRARARVHGVTGPKLTVRLVDAMAGVEAELIEADWAGLPAQVRSLTASRSLVVVLTPLDSPGASRGLLAMLPQLARDHLVLVASVLDPALATASADREDVAAVYRAAAAERALLDHDRLAAAVRRLGGDVVAAAPADLPPALADRYLALKAAGRL